MDYSCLDPNDVYDFKDGRITDLNDEAASKKYFSISNYYELLEFSISVAYGCCISSNKVIFLESDIDANAPGDKQYANWQPIGAKMDAYKYKGCVSFQGVFDGNGFTIKNLTCRVDTINWITDNQGDYFGLFSFIEGRANIKNLRLKNFKVISNSDQSMYVGAIAGGAKPAGTTYQYLPVINNCLVDGFNVTINNNSKSYVGGIIGGIQKVGTSSPVFTVEDCQLKNLTLPTNTSWTAKVGPANTFMASGVISNKDAVANYENVSVQNGTWGLYNDKNLTVNTCLIYTEKTLATAGLKNKDCWHVPPSDEFNNGWPHLIKFIKFTNYRFVSEDNGRIVGTDDVDVPEEISLTLSANSPNIVVYGETISAAANSGYKFKNWTYDSTSRVYTANFELLPIEIKLNDIFIPGTDIVEKSIQKIDDSDFVGELEGTSKLSIRYSIGSNYIVLWSDDGYSDSFHISNVNLTVNPNKAEWDKHTVKEFNISTMYGGEKQTVNIYDDVLNTYEYTMQDIADLLGVTLADLAQNGIIIDITFTLKTYGVEVE